MDWLFGWFHGLLNSFVWSAIFSRFVWIDWITFALLVVGVIYGIKKGFMREWAEISEVCILVCLTLQYYQYTAIFIRSIFQKLSNSTVLLMGFMLTGGIFAFLILMIDGKIKELVKTQTAKPLKVVGGAVLGMFHFLLMWSLICQALILIPSRTILKAFHPKVSYSGRPLKDMAPQVHSWVRGSLKYLTGSKR